MTTSSTSSTTSSSTSSTSIFKPNKYSIDNGDIITVHITNINSKITLQRIFEEFLFLRFGDIIQIVLKGYSEESRKSEAYIDFNYFDKRLLEQLEIVGEPVEFFQIDGDPEGDGWRIQKKKLDTHFYIEKNQKDSNQVNLIIQAISSGKTVHDVHFLFRELGVVEQVDLIWSKKRDCSLAVRGQAYVYFKEWFEEIQVCKFFDELRTNNMLTFKYDYDGYKDLLWIYELFPSAENTIDYGFEFGDYYRGVPDNREGWENDKRLLKNNNLSWMFLSSGKLAYSDKIGQEEIKKYGGLFIENKLIKFNYKKDENDSEDSEDSEDVEDVEEDTYLKNGIFPEHYNIFDHIKYNMEYSYELYDDNDNSVYVDEDLLNIEDCKKVIMRTCKRTLDNGL